GGVLMREHRIVNAYTSGTDLHSYVASLVFKKSPEEVTKNERTAAKAGSFTLLFAGGVPGLQSSARQGGLQLSRNEAEEIIDAYMDAFPAVAAFVARIRRQVQGRQVFPLRIPRGPRRVLVRRAFDIPASQVINTLVQGTAAAGLKHALIRIKEAGIGDMVRAVVHDEIVLE